MHRAAFRSDQPALVDLREQQIAAVAHHGLRAHWITHRSRDPLIMTFPFQGVPSEVQVILGISLGSL